MGGRVLFWLKNSSDNTNNIQLAISRDSMKKTNSVWMFAPYFLLKGLSPKSVTSQKIPDTLLSTSDCLRSGIPLNFMNTMRFWNLLITTLKRYGILWLSINSLASLHILFLHFSYKIPSWTHEMILAYKEMLLYKTNCLVKWKFGIPYLILHVTILLPTSNNIS